jgi:hypothetical protein
MNRWELATDFALQDSLHLVEIAEDWRRKGF